MEDKDLGYIRYCGILNSYSKVEMNKSFLIQVIFNFVFHLNHWRTLLPFLQRDVLFRKMSYCGLWGCLKKNPIRKSKIDISYHDKSNNRISPQPYYFPVHLQNIRVNLWTKFHIKIIFGFLLEKKPMQIWRSKHVSISKCTKTNLTSLNTSIFNWDSPLHESLNNHYNA